MEVILIYVNFPTEESARQIGTALIEKQLAACVNLIPGVESIYRWEGAVQTEKEVTALIKTTQSRYQQVEQCVLAMHPYENPEVIAVNVEEGSELYLNWVKDQMEGHH